MEPSEPDPHLYGCSKMMRLRLRKTARVFIVSINNNVFSEGVVFVGKAHYVIKLTEA
jgi:glutamine cyclotransferase